MCQSASMLMGQGFASGTCASDARKLSVGGSSSDPIERLLGDTGRRAIVEKRFWEKARIVDGCWIWTGARKRGVGPQSYGNFKLEKRLTVRAHRLAFALGKGRSPGALCVCHRCDTPACVNPDHLFLGTHKDNSDDKIAKGRTRHADASGEKNPGAKLTLGQVQEIRGLILGGETNVSIAARFGVTHQLVSRIRRGRSWGSEAMQPKYASLRR